MHRRDFFRTGAQAAAIGAAASMPACSSFACVAQSSADSAPSVLKDYSAEDHRRRLQNIGICTRESKSACASTW